MSSLANQPAFAAQLLLRAHSNGMFLMAESKNDPRVIGPDI
jgi:hypothetical protein